MHRPPGTIGILVNSSGMNRNAEAAWATPMTGTRLEMTGTRLEKARRHVAEGEARLARQRVIARGLAQEGQWELAGVAEDLLAEMWMALGQARWHLAIEESEQAEQARTASGVRRRN